MIVVAVTGGIGSGKTEVCKYLEKKGYGVLNCDNEVKSFYEEDALLLKKISDIFGGDMVSDGKLDRKKLSSLVFSDKTKLALLENMVFPVLHSRIESWKKKLESKGNDFCFIESAIITDKACFDGIYDRVLRIRASETVRKIRVSDRDCMPVEEVESRMKMQNESGIYDYEIENSGDLNFLHGQIELFLERLRSDYSDKSK